MKKILVLLKMVLFFGIVTGQGVGVGTTSPDSSSVLDLSSTSKGLLIPRMTTSQRDAIDDPASGLMILNLDDDCIDIYDGVNWIKNCGMKITGTDTLPPAWTQMANFPGTARREAVSFSIDGKGYLGTGLSGATRKKDFWQYDPDTDVWTQKADFGGTAREGAVGCGLNGYGYIGTGLDGQFQRDMWEYTPALNTWVQKSNFPGVGRRNAFCFGLAGLVFVGTGEDGFDEYNNVYAFNPASDSWASAPSFPVDACQLISFVAAGEAYAGLGWMDFSPWGSGNNPYIWRLEGSDWQQVAAFPGTSRSDAIAVGIGDKAYVGFGWNINGPMNDFWTYNAINNTWQQLQSCGAEGISRSTSFAIGNSIYVATGHSTVNLQTVWKYEIYPQGDVYSMPEMPDPVATISDGIWTKNLENIFNNSTGNIGLGMENPKNKIDIQGAGTRTGSHPTNLPFYISGLQSANSAGAEFRDNTGAFGIGLGNNSIYAAGSSADHGLFFRAKGSLGHLLYYTNNVERMRITGAGFVGIGTTAPNAPLQFADAAANRKIVLSETVNNDHQYYGLGMNAATLRYQVDASTSNHIFYAATNATNSTELMRIQGNGRVGIGTNIPDNLFSVLNKVSVDANGSLHLKGAQRMIYFGEDNAAAKMLLSHSPANPTRGLQYLNTNKFRFLNDSNHVMTINLTENQVEVNKLGIGTSTPHGLLQFASVLGTRKIVLFEGVNNDHQFLGFGVETAQLRYQVDAPSASHVFYAAVNGTSSSELMRIKGDGNVGIGINAPVNRLDIQGTVARTGTHATGRPMYITGTLGDAASGVEIRHDNGQQGIGIGQNTLYAAGSNANQNLGLASKGTTGQLLFNTNNTQRMVITGSGNVGIGVAAPNSPLQFASVLGTRKIVLFEGVNNDHQFYGFGVNGLSLRYQVDDAAASHIFYAAIDGTSSRELMRITGDGNVTVAGVIQSEGYIDATLQNSFGQLGGFATVGYFKDEMGIVHLRGSVDRVGDPDGLTIFTLPVGYRPSTSGQLMYAAMNNGGVARVDIFPNGDVHVILGSSGYISLDGITFRAD